MNKQRWFIVVVTLNVQKLFGFKKKVKEVVTACKKRDLYSCKSYRLKHRTNNLCRLTCNFCQH